MKPRNKVGGMAGLSKRSWKPRRDLGKKSVWEDGENVCQREVERKNQSRPHEVNHVCLEAVSVKLIGNRVFAGLAKLRKGPTGVGWALGQRFVSL